jgi:hypothetical protein
MDDLSFKREKLIRRPICNKFFVDKFFIKRVIPFLKENTSIREVDLNLSTLKEISLIAILNLKSVEVLVCSQTGGYGFELTESFGYLIEKNNTLKKLNMRFKSSLVPFINNLSFNKSITDLNVSCVGIEDEGAILLSKNNVLRKLNVMSCDIRKEGVLSLVSSNTLEVLDIRGNIISEEDEEDINKCILNGNIKDLSIYNFEEDEDSFKFVRKINNKRKDAHKEIIKTFLHGSLPIKDESRSPAILTAFYRNKLYDKQLVKEITDFIAPTKFSNSY